MVYCIAWIRNALLWPAIWPLSLEGLGKATSKGSALLVMGAVGGAVGPLLYGLISDVSNLTDCLLNIASFLFIHSVFCPGRI